MASSDAAPFVPVADGLRLFIKLTPRASKNAITGVEPDGEGKARLKVTVTAVPEAGKANAALIKLLAKTWKLPKSSLTIVAGETSRLKELELRGEAAALKAWFAAQEQEKN